MKMPNYILYPSLFVGSLIAFFLLLYKPALEEIGTIQREILFAQNRSHEEKIIARALEEKSYQVERLRAEVGRLRAGPPCPMMSIAP